MYFGTEYISNIKDRNLLDRVIPFALNEMYSNWSTFITLCFDLSGLSSDEIKSIIKKYSKRPPLRTIDYYCSKYNVEKQDIFYYSMWVYFGLGYNQTTTLRIKQMASRLFRFPMIISSVYEENPFRHLNKIFKTDKTMFYVVKNINTNQLGWQMMSEITSTRTSNKLFSSKRNFISYGKKKGWIIPKEFAKHKAKFEVPFNFNPVQS